MAESTTKVASGRIPGETEAPDAAARAARYCPICGMRAKDGMERFGEAFCSDAHAEEFTTSVRAAHIEAAAARTASTPPACHPGFTGRSGWSARVGKALCWGGPALALAILGAVALGGGGLLMGSAVAALPFLAALACPLGMYLMMRSMSRTGQGAGGPRREQDPQ